jgi:hypothetical protein
MRMKKTREGKGLSIVPNPFSPRSDRETVITAALGEGETGGIVVEQPHASDRRSGDFGEAEAGDADFGLLGELGVHPGIAAAIVGAAVGLADAVPLRFSRYGRPAQFPKEERCPRHP